MWLNLKSLLLLFTGKQGLLDLVSSIGGKSSLQSLHASSQCSPLDEAHIADVYTKLATNLGR